MKFSDSVLEKLAKMVVGDHADFPYRSSFYITKFFRRCGLPFEHNDGSTRRIWAQERLAELNLGVSQSPDLPSDGLLHVIAELFDPDDFDRHNEKTLVESANNAKTLSIEAALVSFNTSFARTGLVAYLDNSGRCHLRNTGTGVNSASLSRQTRPLSAEEIEQRKKLGEFMDSASEDEFTARILVPLFQRLGFHRVSPSGHTEKTLEFGKDLWMKYQIPTGHWIYFCAQVKKDKIDSTGSSGGKNVATVLSQVRMALDHPIFDPDTNRNVLLDHMFIISAGEITRAARQWLIAKLDADQRRHIIFMDRNEFLDHAARILIDLLIVPLTYEFADDIPF